MSLSQLIASWIAHPFGQLCIAAFAVLAALQFLEMLEAITERIRRGKK